LLAMSFTSTIHRPAYGHLKVNRQPTNVVYIYMELLVKPEMLTSHTYMDLRMATLKPISFYLLHNVSTLNRCRMVVGVRVVCKHFAS